MQRAFEAWLNLWEVGGVRRSRVKKIREEIFCEKIFWRK